MLMLTLRLTDRDLANICSLCTNLVTRMERQHLFCMYLAHHGLESVFIIITVHAE